MSGGAFLLLMQTDGPAAPWRWITVLEAAEQARVADEADHPYLDRLIADAAAYIEASAGLVPEPGERVVELPGLRRVTPLHLAPVRAVAIEYRPPDGGAYVPLQSGWRLARQSGRHVIVVDDPAALPAMAAAPDAVRLTLQVGPQTPQDAALAPGGPGWLDLVRRAGLLLIGGWYDGRESSAAPVRAPVPHGVEVLLALARRGVMA